MDDATQQQLTTLYEHVLIEIAEVDKRTRWQPTEPEWWLAMMQVDRAVRAARNALDPQAVRLRGGKGNE